MSRSELTPKTKAYCAPIFLQGVTLFRPDLEIEPSVYKEYFINPETFEFDKKTQRDLVFWRVVFVVLLLAGAFLWNAYR